MNQRIKMNPFINEEMLVIVSLICVETLAANLLMNKRNILQTIKKMIYQLQDLSVLLEFASRYEEQALQLIEEVKKLSFSTRKQGKKWKEAVLPKLQSAFQLLQQSINFYDNCNKIDKTISLCILALRTCFTYASVVDADQHFANKIQIQIFELVKNTLQKNMALSVTCSQLQIRYYLSITTLYKGLNRKVQYKLFVKQFMNVLRINPQRKYKQMVIRDVILATYEDMISFLKKDRVKIWKQMLRFQLWQADPNYQALYDINRRYVKEIYKQFCLLLLLSEFDSARQFLKNKLIQNCKFVWIKLQMLQKLVDFKEAGDISSCKKILDEVNFKNYENAKKMFYNILIEKQ